MAKVATLKYEDGKWKAYYNGVMLCQSQNKHRVIGLIETGECAKAVERGVTRIEENPSVNLSAVAAKGSPVMSHVVPLVQKPRIHFTVNQRFEMLEDFTDMVIAGDTKAMLVTGDGGLGKSYTVMARYKQANLINSTEHAEEADLKGLPIADFGDYQIIKGKSTPRVIFDTLFHNREKTVVYDDCDSALDSPDSKMIMKGALDTTEKRIITWGARAQIGSDDDVPNTFEFKGQVIFISNKRLEDIDQAILTRCVVMDLSLTTDEKIERMETILENIRRDIPFEHRRAALDLMTEYKDEATNLNIRALEQIAGFRRSYPTKWKNMAIYTLTATSTGRK